MIDFGGTPQNNILLFSSTKDCLRTGCKVVSEDTIGKWVAGFQKQKENEEHQRRNNKKKNKETNILATNLLGLALLRAVAFTKIFKKQKDSSVILVE